MSTTTLATPPLRHSHVFDQGNPLAERNTRWAVLLTALMMVAEIVGGYAFNSMALLADGWHMSSHALALGLSVAAYAAARRWSADGRFAFGTWKIEILGGYSSALLLVGVALLMLWQSVDRLLHPAPIHYGQAIAVAALGLAVNLACAWLLRGAGHHHGHSHGHSHGDGHGHPHAPASDADHSHDAHSHDAHAHGDLNLRAAYLHVLADAATSVLAIAALFGGLLWGADWLDPLMGLAGAVLVAVWARGLLRDTSRVLLDAEMDAPVVTEIREAIAASPIPAEITDLHVWRVGRDHYAVIASLITPDPHAQPEDFKRLLRVHEELVHLSVEVNRTASPAECGKP